MLSFLRKKQARQVTISERDLAFSVPPGASLLEAMLANGIAMPHDCKVGTCGTCRYRLEEGKIGELSPSALSLTREDLEAGYRLACQTIPRSDLRIAVDRLHGQMAAIAHYDAEIIATPNLSHDIIGLTLRLDRPITFTAGQHADLTAPGLIGARSYSFAFAPKGEAAGVVRFHVRKVPGGAFTEWLFAADRTGTKLQLSGPDGYFGLHDADASILCIAGGSGLAPILSILEEAQWAGTTRPVTLLYGARTRKDLYCTAEIEALRKGWPDTFDFLPVLSAEPEDSAWAGARGLVSDYIDKVAGLAGRQAYLCGPPPMIDAAEAALLAAGLTSDAIKADRFYDRSRQGA